MLPRGIPALLLLAAVCRAVTPLPVGSLLHHPAHYFDLEHQRVRFSPRGASTYSVASSPFRGELHPGKPLGPPTDPKSYSWRTSLPFAFPFAGQTWHEVYINLNGSLTFGEPEDQEYPERDSWPDGTMRLLASFYDTSSIAGSRRMIVPLWGLNSA